MSKNTKFDREIVIQKATNLYWEKGFHGTSMRNLQEVIDMRPGSIYACFGSKEGLFKEALGQYAQMGIDGLQQSQTETSSSINALKLFMKRIIIESDDAPSCMCLLAKTVAELTEDNLELLDEAKRLLKLIECEFITVLKNAQKKGEISLDKNSQELARHLQIQIMGLRTYTRVAGKELPLHEMIDNVFKHHPF